MPKIYDVTVPLSPEVPTYPGDPPFELRDTHRIADGERYNATRLALGGHLGTHVDAPSHFIEGGATIDHLPFEILIGKARVVEVAARERIDRSHLETFDLRDHIRVLLKTRMSGQMLKPQVQEDYVYLTVDAARHLVHAGIKLVGIDYLSVDRFGSADYPSHHALLEAGVVIVEGLDLSEVAEGEYDMTCLPLRIAGAEAAPARVILRTRL
jgi:arylformamidase